MTAVFQKVVTSKNSIGEMERSFATVATRKGFLDLSSGSSSYTSYSAKTEESTHVFICDWFDIDRNSVTRLLIGERVFDVLYLDEPMGKGYHFEVYLKEVIQHG